MEACFADDVKAVNPSMCLDTLLGSAGKEVIVMDNQLWLKKTWVRRKTLYTKFVALDNIIFGRPSRNFFRASKRCGKAKP